MSSDLDLVSRRWWQVKCGGGGGAGCNHVSYHAARLRASSVPGNKHQVPLRYTDSKRKWFVQEQITTLEKV